MQKLLGPDDQSCPAEENVEAICLFLRTAGKQLDHLYSRQIMESYFKRLKDLETYQQLSPRMRFMVRDVTDLRANNWIPRQEEY